MKILLVIILVFSFSIACSAQQDDVQMRIFNVKHGDTDSVYQVLDHMKSPDGKVTAHTATGNIIVIDHPANLQQMTVVMAKVDVRKEQVMITVVIADVGRIFIEKGGLTLGQSVLTPENFGKIQYLLEQGEDSLVKTEMSVRTLSGKPARIQTGTNKEFVNTWSVKGGVLVIVAAAERFAGDMLEVIPRVNSDGTIEVAMRPEVSEFRTDSVKHERSAFTRVSVKNGETIVVGSIDSSGEYRRQSKLLHAEPTIAERTTVDNIVMMFLTVDIL
ncbi:MAG: hypothetical protein P9L88_01145 [Candidatus Tantalella remota]|nr:hypothetical protein [Candidatus Tantalella remota]